MALKKRSRARRNRGSAVTAKVMLGRPDPAAGVKYFVHLDQKVHGPFYLRQAQDFARIGSASGGAKPRRVTRGPSGPLVRIYERGKKVWPATRQQALEGKLRGEEMPREWRAARANPGLGEKLDALVDKVRQIDDRIAKIGQRGPRVDRSGEKKLMERQAKEIAEMTARIGRKNPKSYYRMFDKRTGKILGRVDATNQDEARMMATLRWGDVPDEALGIMKSKAKAKAKAKSKAKVKPARKNPVVSKPPKAKKPSAADKPAKRSPRGLVEPPRMNPKGRRSSCPVEAYLSKMQPGESIDLAGLERATGVPWPTAKYVADAWARAGKLVIDGKWYEKAKAKAKSTVKIKAKVKARKNCAKNPRKSAALAKSKGGKVVSAQSLKALAKVVAEKPRNMNEKVGKILETTFAAAGIPPAATRVAWKTASAVEDAQVRAVKAVGRGAVRAGKWAIGKVAGKKPRGKKNPGKPWHSVPRSASSWAGSIKMNAVKSWAKEAGVNANDLYEISNTFGSLQEYASAKHPEVRLVGLAVDSSVHDSPRHFAMTGKTNGKVLVHIAPELLSEPRTVWWGILQHELGHALVLLGKAKKVKGGYDAVERQADRVAEKVFGEKIYYDSRGVEVSGPGATGTRPRPAGLR